MQYNVQFRMVESLIPLNKEFTIETYGKRYLYFTRTAAHQAKYSTMWLDVHLEAGSVDTMAVTTNICPDDGIIPHRYLTYKDTTWSTRWKQNGTTYRIELFSCSDPVGEYFVGFDTRGKYFKATGYAQVIEEDHR